MSGFHLPDELYAADKLQVDWILSADGPGAAHLKVLCLISIEK